MNRNRRAMRTDRSDDIDYGPEIAELTAKLRERDDDPAFKDAPVIDVYARISRVYDTHDSEKVPRQVVECLRNMIGRKDVRLGEVFADPNRSAWKPDGKRPGFDALIERVESGKNRGVLTWHVDRLARQPWDLERLLRLVLSRRERRRGYLIASCHGDHKLSDVATLRMKMVFAAEESEAKSRRLRDLNEARRAAGIVKGGLSPFGHRFPGEDDITDEYLATERDALAWGIHHVVAAGSLGSVAREWNRRGLTTRNGLAFNPLNVKSHLLLARHAGLLEFEGEVLRPLAGVEPIVDAVTFERLRAVFSSRKRGTQPGEAQHFLSSLVMCDACGLSMIGSTLSGKRCFYPDGQRRRVYRCSPRGTCGRVGVDARAAEHFARLQTVRILSDPRNATMIAERSAALTALDGKIGAYERMRDDLHGKAMADPTRYDYYAAQVERVESMLTPLSEERRRLVHAGAGRSASALDRDAVDEQWRNADPAGRRIMFAQALPDGFYVAPVGKARRLRGDAILTRFSIHRGEASARFG